MNFIRLNVGGTVFQTTASTLTKYDGFFKTMMTSNVPFEKDDTGCTFIDRDPKHFRRILNFMRDGNVALPESMQEIYEIDAEAGFYLLEGLIFLCQAKIDEDLSNQEKKFLANRYRRIRFVEEGFDILMRSKKPVLLITFDRSRGDVTIPGGRLKFDKLIEYFESRLDIWFQADSTWTIRLNKGSGWTSIIEGSWYSKNLDEVKIYIENELNK